MICALTGSGVSTEVHPRRIDFSLDLLTLFIFMLRLSLAVCDEKNLQHNAQQQDNWHIGYTDVHLHRHHYHPMPLHSALEDTQSVMAQKKNRHKEHRINDKVLNARYQAEADREHLEKQKIREAQELINRAGSLVALKEKMRRKSISHVAGVTNGALENARNVTLSGDVTSCAEIIAQNFASGASPPPIFSNESQTWIEGVRTRRVRPKRVLFNHIPRNAGDIFMRAFMTPAAREAAVHPNEWRKHNESYDWSETRHGFKDITGKMHSNRAKVTFNAQYFDCKCSYWQTPIRYLERGEAVVVYSKHGDFNKVANAYKGSEVLCAVRDPLDRALSEFKKDMDTNKDLSNATADAHAFLIDLATHLWTKKLCWNACHFLPQCDYVYNWYGRRTCHHVLRYGRSLKHQLDSVLDVHDESSQLPFEDSHDHGLDLKNQEATHARKLWTENLENQYHSHIQQSTRQDKSSFPSVSDIHPEVAKIVRCAYALDLCLLGFDPATGAHLSPEKGPLVDTGCVP